MKRTRTNESVPSRLPDAIRMAPADEFTQVPNHILRDPRISFKAKGLLCTLLSNQSGKWVSYLTTLQKFSNTEGLTSLRSGLKELEEAGYLLKVFYVDKRTKQRRGSFWAYTNVPGRFEIQEHLDFLEQNGLEVQGGRFRPSYLNQLENGEPNLENPNLENLNLAHLNLGDPTLKILIDKNTKGKNISFSQPDFPMGGEEEKKGGGKPSIQERNECYVPLAERLAQIVRQAKNINITSTKIRGWANEIRKLVETDGVSTERIGAALDWYARNIGGQYIPVIESGSSLREKFTRLEDAMKRSGYISTSTEKKKEGPTEHPRKIIRKHFSSRDLAEVFYRDCYLLAEQLLDYAVKEDELCKALLNFHSQVEQKQKKNLSPELQRLLPGPIDLISHYINWIEDNHWVTNITVDLFNIDHKLFRRFCREEAGKDNLERDPLTGKSYLRG